MVTVGTRNVSAVKCVPSGAPCAPKPATNISKLALFSIGDGTEIVGSRLLESSSDDSPYLPLLVL